MKTNVTIEGQKNTVVIIDGSGGLGVLPKNNMTTITHDEMYQEVAGKCVFPARHWASDTLRRKLRREYDCTNFIQTIDFTKFESGDILYWLRRSNNEVWKFEFI